MYISAVRSSRKIVSFLSITFLFSWGIAAIGHFAGVNAASGIPFMLLAALVMFCPAIAAIIQQRLIDKEKWIGLGLGLKGTNWRIVIATAILGMCLVPLCLLVLSLLGDGAGIISFGHVSITTDQLIKSFQKLFESAGADGAEKAIAQIENIPAGFVLAGAMIYALLAAATANLPFMLGEELGWRGYLFQRTAEWSGAKRILFTGSIWGIWHAPLIAMGHNYPEYPIAGIGMMVIFCILAAFLFDWTRSRSGSIWSSCILHGLINGSAGTMVLFSWGGHPLVGTIVGVAGFIAMLIAIVVIVLFDRKYRALLFAPIGSAGRGTIVQ